MNLAAGRVRDGQGRLRLVLPVPGWEDFLVLALDEIRCCGASSIQVMRRRKDALEVDRQGRGLSGKRRDA